MICRTNTFANSTRVPIALRAWLAVAGMLIVSLCRLAVASDIPEAPRSLLPQDYRTSVSRANLRIDGPAEKSEAGLPIGNGRMGSLVWTTPEALHLQVNRVDVFSSGSNSRSFPERHTDYCGGCGFVDVVLAGAQNPVFTSQSTTQELSCYDGVASIAGAGVAVRAFAWPERDVMVLDITDKRTPPEPIEIIVRALRPLEVRTFDHLAASKLQPRDGDAVLTQTFSEGNFHCSSALVVGTDRNGGALEATAPGELRLRIPAGSGRVSVFIASAASFKKNANVIADATHNLKAARDIGVDQLSSRSQAWWHSFWSSSFLSLTSSDGVADSLEQHWNYFLYVMASSSRGAFPTKFNGMLWTTGGDSRKWGAQYWGANQSCLYNNSLFAANHAELMEPMFRMYSGISFSCKRAAREQWGSQGIFFPETLAFDGLAPLPPAIAAEMRDLYLLRKPWQERSSQFMEYARMRQPHSSRWNWMSGGTWVDGRWQPEERGGGPYGPVTHIFSRGAKIAYQYWLRYEYTADLAWLRKEAYPILSEVADFYAHYPNLRKEADGRYHIHHVNSNESVWGARDTDEEIASMMGILPVAIRASEILGKDKDRRERWRELLENLAPLPTRTEASLVSSEATPTWIRGLQPAVRGNPSGTPDGNTMPAWFFDLCTMESDPQNQAIAQATFDRYLRRGTNASAIRVGVLSKVPLAAAILGRTNAVRELIPAQVHSTESRPMANRMDLREGFQTMSVQRLGNAADALHSALIQSLPPTPGEVPVIRLFPAWPAEWDARFRLRVRGGFMVDASIKGGVAGPVEIQSSSHGECLIHNPWRGKAVQVQRNGLTSILNGEVLRLPAAKGDRIFLRPVQ